MKRPSGINLTASVSRSLPYPIPRNLPGANADLWGTRLGPKQSQPLKNKPRRPWGKDICACLRLPINLQLLPHTGSDAYRRRVQSQD